LSKSTVEKNPRENIKGKLRRQEMMIRLIVLFGLVISGKSLLLFRNPVDTKAIYIDKTGEKGNYTKYYTQAVLPHAQNDDLTNPVYKLTGLGGRFLQLCIETIEDGAAVSCQDNTAGPVVSVQGQGCHCWQPGADVLLFEFFCTDSCQTTDTDFYFRFVWSPPTSEIKQPDMWCGTLPSEGFPSDDRSDPDEVPDSIALITTPTPQVQPSSGNVLTPCIIITVFSLVLVLIQ